MRKSIIESMIDSGAVTESDMLFGLHKTGKVDVAKLIKETVSNIKCEVSEMTNAEAVVKLRETSTYLGTMASIIEDIDNDNEVRIDEDTAPTTVTVVGSN